LEQKKEAVQKNIAGARLFVGRQACRRLGKLNIAIKKFFGQALLK